MKQWLIISGAIIVLIAVVIATQLNSHNRAPTVTDFASCAAAGNAIMLSYPEQCHHNGTTYTNPDQQPVAPPPVN